MHKLMTVGLAAVLVLSACTNYPLPTPEEYAAVRARNQRFEDDKPKLQDAQNRNVVSCSGEAACAKAWRMTKNFIEMHSYTRLTQYDDTRIDTSLSPWRPGMISLSARRMDNRAGAKIYLSIYCIGMYGDTNRTVPGPGYLDCSDSIMRLSDLFGYDVKSQVE
ncbi:hypothetical protein AWB71_06013 [Caballeronia peredens]|nr:hypothetical protein AWB71_06013 [Caballeronia peredens]